jgi:hypothetical protein
MKLTSTQLKQIIREETAKVIAKKKINEGPDVPNQELENITEFANLLSFYEQAWLAIDDGSDPSINASKESQGEQAWDHQVAMALNELSDRITEVINEVETGLINGDYGQ